MAIMPRHLDPPGAQGGGAGRRGGGRGSMYVICASTICLILVTVRQVVAYWRQHSSVMPAPAS
ncbi:hypothetical protein BKH28_12240 [Actinomyces oris]|uniref:Uncharacterized protein n=1 Tax=Actinomyces oris TaxID=544580 RepID=A0A1Q8VHC7_9ACTO|nr:hypothetical protein BKH28_12240 [Actinomyces oris]